MCGITGKIYLDRERKISSDELKSMADAIVHRGPDDEGFYIKDNVGLGFRRLSIIDLHTGHQPLVSDNGNYWITFNGEVYNFKEQRAQLEKKGYTFKTNTDTEVIVNLYQEYGEDCVQYLRGMFAFVIWDEQKQQLFGARDRFGIKPFYYYLDNEKFVWSSEIKSILKSGAISTSMNYNSLDYYFAYGYLPRHASIYNEVQKLKPGHSFVFRPHSEEKLKISQYWKIEFEPDYSKSESYWKEALYEELNKAVKMRMVSDVPLGAFLSGGIDSSTVVSLMSLNSESPIKTFSIGFKEEKFNELKYARMVSEKYGTDHHEFIVEPESVDLLPKLVSAYDEPFSDTSAIPTYYVSKLTREHVTVALSGDGGDELFAGYEKYSKMMRLNGAFYNNRLTNNLLFSPLNKLIPDYFYGKGLSYYLSKDKELIGAYFCMWKDYERRKVFLPEVRTKLNNFSAENLKRDILNSTNADYISRKQKLDMQTYMVDDILTKVDRASMMNSLEVRVPLLDHEFAELSFKIPSEFKMKNTDKKYILKESFKHILPEEIISHKKQGFGVPLKVWFKEDLKEYAYSTLLSDSKLDAYLNKKYINQILENHQKGMRDYNFKIWSLLFLNEWLKQNDI